MARSHSDLLTSMGMTTDNSVLAAKQKAMIDTLEQMYEPPDNPFTKDHRYLSDTAMRERGEEMKKFMGITTMDSKSISTHHEWKTVSFDDIDYTDEIKNIFTLPTNKGTK